MLTHYIDIQIAKPSIAYELHGRVVMAVHMSIVRGQPIALDWPQWRDTYGGFGHVVRLLGTPAALDCALTLLNRYQQADLIGFSAIEPVPAHAVTQWGYVRARRAEKNSASYRRRQLRRHPDWKEDEKMVPQRKINHLLPLQSLSTQRLFKLKMCRVPASQVSGELNHYGMAVAIPSWS